MVVITRKQQAAVHEVFDSIPQETSLLKKVSFSVDVTWRAVADPRAVYSEPVPTSQEGRRCCRNLEIVHPTIFSVTLTSSVP